MSQNRNRATQRRKPQSRSQRLKQPVESETEVIDLNVALRQPASPIRGVQFRISFLRQNQTVRRMRPPRRRLLTAIGEALEGILANVSNIAKRGSASARSTR